MQREKTSILDLVSGLTTISGSAYDMEAEQQLSLLIYEDPLTKNFIIRPTVEDIIEQGLNGDVLQMNDHFLNDQYCEGDVDQIKTLVVELLEHFPSLLESTAETGYDIHMKVYNDIMEFVSALMVNNENSCKLFLGLEIRFAFGQTTLNRWLGVRDESTKGESYHIFEEHKCFHSYDLVTQETLEAENLNLQEEVGNTILSIIGPDTTYYYRTVKTN